MSALLPLCAVSLLALAAGERPAATADYVFGLLRKGPIWTAERTAVTDSLQRGHMANIQRMAEAGALLGAGPVLDGGDLRGIFLFRGDSIESLRRMAEADPAIAAGRLRLELYPWRAPAGIGEGYRRMAARPDFRDSMITLRLGLLKRGPNRALPSRRLGDSRQAFLAARLRSGEYAVHGPLSGAGDLLEIVVARGDSASAWRVAARDPAVKGGWLVPEFHPWMVAHGVMPESPGAPPGRKAGSGARP